MKIIPYILLIFLLGCKPKQEEEIVVEKPSDQIAFTEVQFKNADIELGTLQEQNVGTHIKFSGTVEAMHGNFASVSAPMGGYIQSINLIPGQYVRKGQALFQISNPDFVQLQENYFSAKAKMDYAAKDLKRQQLLNEGKAVSDKALDAAKTEYNLQKTLMESAKRQLALVNIRVDGRNSSSMAVTSEVTSPIKGYIHAVSGQKGAYVSPSDKVVEIVNTADVALVLNVFERDLPKLEKGMRVIANTLDNANKKYLTNIIYIDPMFDENRSARVHCHFADERVNLTPGTYMESLVELKSSASITLPGEAIVTWEGKQFVFVQDSTRRFKMTPIEIGAEQNDYFEIRNPEVLHGKSIAMKGAYNILMALKNVSDE